METHPNIGDGNMRPNFPDRYRKQAGTSTSEHTARSSGMKRIPLALLLVFLLPTGAMPQRYGRPYSLAPIPQLLLQVSVQKKTHYFSVYELRTMPRSVVTETDPETNRTHVYEGVALDQLAPTGDLHSTGGIVEIEYGSHQIQTISGSALDTLTELTVVDTVDGKPLSADAPYSFVAQFPRKPVLRISEVHRVAVKMS